MRVSSTQRRSRSITQPTPIPQRNSHASVGIQDYSIFDLAISATLVSAVVIIARFAWMYSATYIPRWLIPAVRRKDPSPPWQWPTALAFTGVRGIVSLVAALGIPFTTDNGEPFP
jgi:CPA1 family monovalent cation:H+ antiporter